MARPKAPTFEEFWKAYPVHKGIVDARAAWNRLSATDKSKALAGIAAYRDECLRTGVAFCYGQKYLIKQRWTDEPQAKPETAGLQDVNTADALEGMEEW